MSEYNFIVGCVVASEQHLQQIVNERGYRPVRTIRNKRHWNPIRYSKSDRDNKILSLVKEKTLKLEEIGRRFSITRERVRQIVKKAGKVESYDIETVRLDDDIDAAIEWGKGFITRNEVDTRAVDVFTPSGTKKCTAGGIILKDPIDGFYRIITDKQFIELKQMHERYKAANEVHK